MLELSSCRSKDINLYQSKSKTSKRMGIRKNRETWFRLHETADCATETPSKMIFFEKNTFEDSQRTLGRPRSLSESFWEFVVPRFVPQPSLLSLPSALPGPRAQGPRSRVQSLGSRVQGSGSRIPGPGSRIQGLGSRDQGPGGVALRSLTTRNQGIKEPKARRDVRSTLNPPPPGAGRARSCLGVSGVFEFFEYQSRTLRLGLNRNVVGT